MDKKALSELKESHTLFLSGNFSERDVKSFLMLIREQLPQNSIVREICHFAAHRERDKGSTVGQLSRLNTILQNGHIPNDINANGLYNFYDIFLEINKFFEQHGLSKIELTVVCNIIACIMSIMQEIPLTKDDIYLGKLFILLFPNSIGIYIDLDASKAFTVYTPVGPNNNITFAMPIIKIECAYPFISNESIQTAKDMPVSIEIVGGKPLVSFNKEVPTNA